MWPERTAYVEVILNKTRRGLLSARVQRGRYNNNKTYKKSESNVVIQRQLRLSFLFNKLVGVLPNS